MDEALEAAHGASMLDAMRVRASLPDVVPSSSRRTTVFVVEQNRDGQMRTLLINELEIDPAAGRGAALRRHADHRALHHPGDRRSVKATGRAEEGRRRVTYIAKPRLHHPTADQEQGRLHPARLRGRDLDAVRRLRPRFDLGGHHPGLLGAGHRAAPRRQAVGHRLLVEDADYFLGASHGFNTVHGRMPSVLTGANLANRA